MPPKVLIPFLCTFFLQCLQAQPVNYPKYYFRNPLGIPIKLAANFGELRSDHWHMGLDIRTNQKENFPVYAAAAGYIAQIGIRPQSFGRFIIINHPNGYSTLYAHLNDFFPALEKYVQEQQYRQEKWAIELSFSKEKFPVFKSQLIAFSGNTGGSQGPHLHFEIRDTKTDRCINPLFFGLPFKDDKPPVLVKIALYDRSRSLYDQDPQFFSLKKTDSGYIIPDLPVMGTGLQHFSFAIQAYDLANGSASPNGIYSAQLYLDGSLKSGFQLDSIHYRETVYINAHIDYRYRSIGGAFLQHLSLLPGDPGTVYRAIDGRGIIGLPDTTLHKVKIIVKDEFANSSQLNFNIQYTDSLVLPRQNVRENYKGQDPLFVPGQYNFLGRPDFKIEIPGNCIYDTIVPYYNRTNSVSLNSVSAIHQVNDPSFPLHDDVTVYIKPDKNIPPEWKDKLVIQRSSRDEGNVKKAAVRVMDDSLKGEWLTAKFGDFGNFQAFADLEAPRLDDPGTGDTIDFSPASFIRFEPVDNFGIKNFRAELDSQWICFTNDKGRQWVYQFDAHCSFGVHRLTVKVTDGVGNETSKSWWFKRYPYTAPKKKSIHRKKTGLKKKPVIKKTNHGNIKRGR